ncbi:MAG: hypothetical protein AAB322_09525, partial [Pseudomonadota bacterium]
MRLFRHAGQWLLCALVAGCAAAPVPTPSSPPPAEQSASVPAPAPVAPQTAPSESGTARTSKAEASEVRIVAVGDIMLGGTAGPEMQKY